MFREREKEENESRKGDRKRWIKRRRGENARKEGREGDCRMMVGNVRALDVFRVAYTTRSSPDLTS